MFHATASILEEKIQKVFENIKNRRLFVIRHNCSHFENVFKE